MRTALKLRRALFGQVRKPYLFEFSTSADVLRRNQDIINNFTPISSNVERIKLIFEKAVTAFRDPENADAVSQVGDLTNYSCLLEIKEKMMKSETGRHILQEKPRLREGEEYLKSLLALKPNTFGHNYAKWMLSHGYSPKERPIVKYIPDFDLAYIYQRYKEIHDFIHILLYYDTSVHNELVVKWFEMVHFGLPSAGLSSLFGPFIINPCESSDLMLNHVPRAVKNAKECEFLMNIYFEKELETDLGLIESIEESETEIIIQFKLLEKDWIFADFNLTFKDSDPLFYVENAIKHRHPRIDNCKMYLDDDRTKEISGFETPLSEIFKDRGDKKQSQTVTIYYDFKPGIYDPLLLT